MWVAFCSTPHVWAWGVVAFLVWASGTCGLGVLCCFASHSQGELYGVWWEIFTYASQLHGSGGFSGKIYIACLLEIMYVK
jgi:hypothetical protein